ncbi:hypothetical protein K9M74_05040 [Candidatus Woesearchaeota archaeon]|nr:hypothetical protein [Candidatus Woesearchaeota archaeon]
MGNKVTSFLVVLLITIVLLQSSFTFYKVFEATVPDRITAKASTGSISLCINNPPVFLPYLCNTTLHESEPYDCQLFATEADNATLYYEANTLEGLINFSVDENGLATTVPTQEAVGENKVMFAVSDGSICSNAYDYLLVNFTVINVNSPPRYLPNYNIVDEMGPYGWDTGSSLRGVYLNTFFDDPDGDPLTYSYYGLSSGFFITIASSSELIFSSSECGEGHVFFRATDPSGAYADSGLVTLTVRCSEDVNAGAGGGFTQDCESEWQCDDWGRCLPEGIQKKKCTDIYACEEEYIKWFTQPCEYIPQCNNGIRDFFWEGSERNEDGIDCGGPCPVCETCDDGLLNNEEVAVDCGGPNCPACIFCDDGIQNFGETGVDCGGPCEACPSCFDGIKNQNETGVDCGGPCDPCTRIETPVLIQTRSIFATLGSIVLGLVALLIVLYHLFRNQIHAVIAYFFWFVYRNRRKQILLKPEQKEKLFSRINLLEKRNLLADKKRFGEFQNEVVQLLHTFFEFILINNKLKMHLAPEKTLENLNKIKTTNQVKIMLKRQFSVFTYLERKEVLLKEELETYFELLRQTAFSVTSITRSDIARVIEEKKISKKRDYQDFIRFMYNGLLALQFNEVVVAKKKYFAAYELYGSLTSSEQEKAYPLLRLFFDQITYVSSYYKNLGSNQKKVTSSKKDNKTISKKK